MAKKKPLILSLVGARPQFIKVAPLAGVISRRFLHHIIHTGQHYDLMMSEVFFRELAIPGVARNLGVGSGHHAEMTAKIMLRFEKLLLRQKPDLVLVYGDTNSTIAGALTAAKMNIPVGHVEAGLRAFRRNMPEEINRVLTDHVSSLLFCPTAQAVKNLRKEGIIRGIVRCGDLMYELIEDSRRRILTNRRILNRYGLVEREYLLLTLHRAETVDYREKLAGLVDIISRLPIPVIFPVHPRALKNLRRFRQLKRLLDSPGVQLIDPLSYLDNLSLIARARAVLTDSGGMQKESVFLGIPCLTLREETEWPETLRRGNRLVGLSERKIMAALSAAGHSTRRISCRIRGQKPSTIIIESLLKFLKGR
ncbi:MAG: UDP-N-acetylglucosamine 2-epimerase (non-hydrolyzing) [Candidatus Zixiibacteriota bacterium]|nr:MAG: UDP-N-acetylglucosamine 2-epimerase (non-hydrolyzing) [candidate division Zixibacteria bacterium]